MFIKYLNLCRWSNKYVVLDCPTDMAKDIVVSHVRDVALGKRTYHYLLSGLVRNSQNSLIPYPLSKFSPQFLEGKIPMK